MMTLLKGLFENLKLGDAASKIIFEERDNFDFTDHLWKIISFIVLNHFSCKST
jgi:hypothetical protein